LNFKQHGRACLIVAAVIFVCCLLGIFTRPIAYFNGIVENFDLVSGVLKLNVSIFGRNTPVEISYTQVERIV
jgi:hypothetical protein